MPTITIANLPQTLYEELKRRAAHKRRNLSDEIIAVIQQGIRSREVDPGQMIIKARHLRQMTAGFPLTDEILNQANKD